MFWRMRAFVREALTVAAVQVFGNDHAVAFAGSQGNFQLNVYKPIMLHNVLTSIELPTEPLVRFLIVPWDRANKKRIREHLGNCRMLVTGLNPHIGYEKAAKISLAAGAIAEVARQALKIGFRSINREDMAISDLHGIRGVVRAIDGSAAVRFARPADIRTGGQRGRDDS